MKPPEIILTPDALPKVERFYRNVWRPLTVRQRRARGFVGTEAEFVEHYRVTNETLRNWARKGPYLRFHDWVKDDEGWRCVGCGERPAIRTAEVCSGGAS